MSIPHFIKNINKHCEDLIKKDFDFNLPSIKVETKAENNATFTFEGKRVIGSKDVKEGEFLIDPFQYRYEVPEWGLAFIGNARSNRKLGFEVSVKNRFATGLKISTSVATTLANKGEPNQDNAAKFGFEYARDNVATTGDMEFFKRIVNLSAVVGNKTYNAGGEVEADLFNGVINEYNLIAAYNPGGFVVTGFGNVVAVVPKDDTKTTPGTTIGTTIYKKMNESTTVGAKIGYKLNGTDVTAIIGGERKLDKDTTIKVKADYKGPISFSYVQNVRKNVRIALATEINLLNLNKPDAHKFGVGFTLTDE